MPEQNTSRLFPFGFVRRSNNPEGNFMYSVGLPKLSSIYADQFMRNLRAGRPGYAGFPDWFTSQPGGPGSGGGSTPPGSGGGSPNFGNLPQWWRDWYSASGKHGGVPPVEGLL